MTSFSSSHRLTKCPDHIPNPQTSPAVPVKNDTRPLDHWIIGSFLILDLLCMWSCTLVCSARRKAQLKTPKCYTTSQDITSLQPGHRRTAISSSLLHLNHVWSQSIPKLSLDKTCLKITWCLLSQGVTTAGKTLRTIDSWHTARCLLFSLLLFARRLA